MLKILFIGDIVGKIGRKTVAKIVPKLKKDLKLDLIIANAENSAHGSGVTEDTAKGLINSGIDVMTTGDHALDRLKQAEIFEKYPLIRPANLPPAVPGNGFILIPIKNFNVLLINLIGRVFMQMDYDCPFRKLDEILANINLQGLKPSAIIIDMHAEATSEKAAIKFYADGRISALLGTHTHIPTSDQEITGQGTAFISDVGMVGAKNTCLGVDKAGIIDTFLTQIKHTHVIPEKGQAVFNAVLLTIDPKTSQTKSIKPISKTINIK